MDYEKPELTDLGDLQDLTASTNTGAVLDAAAMPGQIPGQGNLSNP